MKNTILALVFLVVFIMSIVQEPVTDTLDALAGATNDTYRTSVDGIASASIDDDDDEEDDD